MGLRLTPEEAQALQNRLTPETNFMDASLKYAKSQEGKSTIAKKAKTTAASEHKIQAMLVTMCQQATIKYPELKALYAIPNGADTQRYHDPNTGEWLSPERNRLVKEGLKPGVWDLCLPIPKLQRRNDPDEMFMAAGLWLETKTAAPKTYLTPEQKAWRDLLRKHGHVFCVYRDAMEGWHFIEKYLMGYVSDLEEGYDR